MSKHSYTEIEFKNAPDHKTTPLNATNLNHIEEGITNAFTDISDTQEVIAPVQDTLTASRSYAVGDQFIYQNVLYKATAAISNGGEITIDGNCVASETIAGQITNAIASAKSDLQNKKFYVQQKNYTTSSNGVVQLDIPSLSSGNTVFDVTAEPLSGNGTVYCLQPYASVVTISEQQHVIWLTKVKNTADDSAVASGTEILFRVTWWNNH